MADIESISIDENGRMTLRFKLNPDPPLSGSGKTNTLFTTGGFTWGPSNKALPDGTGINLTVSRRIRRR